MAEVLKNPTNVTESDATGTLEKLQTSPSKISSANASNSDDNLQLDGHHNSEDDAPKKRVKRRIQQFSDSDSDKEITQNGTDKLLSQEESKIPQISDDDSDAVVSKSIPQRSRIQKASNSYLDSDSSDSHQAVKKSEMKEKSKHPLDSDNDSDAVNSTTVPLKPPIQKATSDSDLSDSNQAWKNFLKEKSNIPLGSDSDSDTNKFKSVLLKSPMTKLCNGSDSDEAVKNDEQQMRMKNKRNKMKDKFKSLLSSRGKSQSSAGAELSPETLSNKDSNSTGDSADNDEATSIEKIKKVCFYIHLPILPNYILFLLF